MSEEYINTIKSILKGILNPDNNARNTSVSLLEEMRKNTPLLLQGLVTVLSGMIFT